MPYILIYTVCEIDKNESDMFSESNTIPQTVSQDIKTTLALGLVVSLVLIAIIGVTSWRAIESLHDKVEDIVEETEVKTGYVYEMKIAARERNLRLMLLLLREDPFEVDDEWMEFRRQGGVFLTAREALLQHALDDDEAVILDKQRGLSIGAVDLQYELYDSVLKGEKEKALKIFNQHLSAQGLVFDALDELLEIQKEKNKEKVEIANNNKVDALKTVVLLSVVVILIMILVTLYTIRRISQQALLIENEAIKFKALIEGGMDAVLVLDNNDIVDCNVNALSLFKVNSLRELNKTGLDYFSRFSEDKNLIDEHGVFSAVNHMLVDAKRKYQWVFANTDGHEFPADVELTGLELQGKSYVQMIIRDVTERERIQQELIDANENLEQKVQERTEELKEVNSKIAGIARSAGMAEVASGVLHNVGNVLNSVNVSTTMLKKQVSNCKSVSLEKLVVMLQENSSNLCDFFENDEKGKMIIPFLGQLVDQLTNEQKKQMSEIESLIKNVEHIKNIITMQQSYTGGSGVIEDVKPSEIVDESIKINMSSMGKHHIAINKRYEYDPVISVDKHKLMQILVNLISNAKYAVINGEKEYREINVGVIKIDDDVSFYVEDNGIGMEEKDMSRIFEFGFKKRAGGHGFGLHHSALAIKDLGGGIFVESNGLGEGARFSITIPLVK